MCAKLMEIIGFIKVETRGSKDNFTFLPSYPIEISVIAKILPAIIETPISSYICAANNKRFYRRSII